MLENTMMLRVKIPLVLEIILLFHINFSLSADFTKGACKEDAQKYCADLSGMERGRCMNENFDKLSPACKANKELFDEKIKNISKFCKEDIQKFCSEVRPGEGKVMKCLRENESVLTSECKSAIPSPRSLFMNP